MRKGVAMFLLLWWYVNELNTCTDCDVTVQCACCYVNSQYHGCYVQAALHIYFMCEL